MIIIPEAENKIDTHHSVCLWVFHILRVGTDPAESHDTLGPDFKGLGSSHVGGNHLMDNCDHATS